MIIRVFIPTYNPDKKALRQTLDSLSFSYCGSIGLAITIVDNNSDVNVEEMIAGIPCDIVHNERNIGRIPNWNKCINLFREKAGDHDAMKFLFVGDTLESECILRQSELIKRGFEIVSTAHRVHLPNKEPYVMNHADEQDLVLDARGAMNKSIISGNWLAGCMACPMFKKNILHDVEFDESMSWASDWKFWTDLMVRAKSIFYLKTPTVNFHAKHRAHFMATQHAVQKQEEDLMKKYVSEIYEFL